MSRNGSGTYTLPSGNPVVSGTLIEATWANSTLSDIASALTDSLSRSGQGGMTAALRLFDGTSSVPGLAWGSETTTGWYRAGAGDMRLVVTGSEIMRYQSTGVGITGTLSASGNFAINTDKFTVAASSGNTAVAGTLTVTGASTFTTFSATGMSWDGSTFMTSSSTAYYPQDVQRNTTNDANASYYALDKNRNGAIVQNGDVLGNIVFRGYDGASYLQGAYINAIVSAAPGTNDMPTDLVFGTTPDGASGPSERMRLNQAGNLGLGVTPSAWNSDVVGLQFGLTGSLSGNKSNSIVGLNNNAILGASGYYYIQSLAASRFEQQSDGSYRWYTAPSGTAGNTISFTQAMTLDTTSFSGFSTLTTNNTTGGIFSTQVNGTNALRIASDSTQGYIFEPRNLPITFSTNGTERARIDSSGNFGIGTSSPTVYGTYKTLEVRGTGGGLLQIGTGTTTAAYLYQDGTNAGFNNIANGVITFGTNNTERARIDSSGNLLVGTTSGTDFKLRVDRSDNNGLCALRNSATSGITYDQLQIMVGQSASANYFFGRFYASSGSSPQFAFRGDGQMFATSTSISSISDARVKENVRDSNDGLQTVLGLRPVRFDFKEGFGNNRKNQLGFIAQEVEGVFPDAVDVAGSVTEDGDAHKSVAPGTLIPVLVKAIQEQQAIIDAQSAALEQLKAQLTSVSADVAALKGAA